MKNFGFTLAEVLITLSVIGVVAAMTIPSLTTSYNNQANASRLATTISTLENAFSNMMVQEGVDSLFQTQAWQGAVNDDVATSRQQFAGNLGRYLKHDGFRTGEEVIAAYTNNPVIGIGSGAEAISCWRSGNQTCGSAKTSNQFISLKNGALVAIHTLSSDDKSAEVIPEGGRLTNEAADVFIDVNGPTEGPNVWGRDNFCFYLGHDGALYACGSRETAIYENIDFGTWWGDSCNLNDDNATGYPCTNRLIENGYRMDY